MTNRRENLPKLDILVMKEWLVAHESIQTAFENNFFKVEPNGFFFEKINFEKITIVRNCEKNSKGIFLQCFYLTI